MKIFIIGGGKTGTTTIHYYLKVLGFKTSNHDPNVNAKIIKKREIYKYDVLSAWPFVCFDKIKEMDNIYPDSKFIFTTRDNLSWLSSEIQHQIRSYVLNNRMYKDKYETYYNLLQNKKINDNKILEYFKNKKNLLIINWSDNEKIEKTQERLNKFLNIKNKKNIKLSIKNKSLSYIDLDNNLANNISFIPKDYMYQFNNNRITVFTNDMFDVLYLLNNNNIKYKPIYSINYILQNDKHNSFIIEKINELNISYDALFKLKNWNFKNKNIVDIGSNDISFIKYCLEKGSNCMSINNKESIKKICQFYKIKNIEFFHSKQNYNKFFRNINNIYFDFIYGYNPIQITEQIDLINLIKNIYHITNAKTKIFIIFKINSNYDVTILNNIEIIKKSGFYIGNINYSSLKPNHLLLYKNINLVP